MSDVLVFGLALLVVLLLIFFVLVYRFPRSVEVFVGQITQVEVNLTGLKIRRATTAANDAQRGKPAPRASTPRVEETLRLLVAPPRLLWVDDHPENNQYEIAMFRAVGIEITTAKSNAEAITVAQRLNPDLVISDIARESEGPKAGLTLSNELRQAGVDVDVVYYVAHASAPQTDFGAPVTESPAELLADVAERLVPKARQGLVRSVVR